MADLARYDSLSVIDHIREKDFWAGTVEPIETAMLTFAPGAKGQLDATYETFPLSPALFKCFDEAIVNALDQAQQCPRTTEISVSYDRASGQIIVENNGDGIPIAKKMHEGREYYIPHFIFGIPFTGTNLKRDTATSTLGGTNGIGVKIANIHSREFRIETIDASRKLAYSQMWTDGMRVTQEPSITPSVAVPFTRLTYTLNFPHFKTEPAEFERVVFTRVIWAAFYASYFMPSLTIRWCGKRIAYDQSRYIDAILRSRASSRSIDSVARRVEISETKNAIVIACPDVKHYLMSVINGIMVPEGNHLEYVSAQIKECAKADLARKLSARDVTDVAGARNITTNMAIIVIWHTTGVHWTSQSKDRAQFRAPDLRKHLALSAAFTSRIGEYLADLVIAKIDRTTSSVKSRAAPRMHIDVDKYTEAHLAGTKRSRDCRLFLAEGNSAKSQVCKGISGSPTLSFDTCGVLSLRGVIVNARKETTIIVDPRTGIARMQRSKKLLDNEFMKTFIDVLGIDYTCPYTTEAQRATLRYGGIVGCVDQDLDGVGNIFSLVLNVMHLYWPALFASGYIQRLETPIIRAFPTSRAGAQVFEFYSDEEYRDWCEANPEQVARYKAEYYKGLGNHSREEMQQIMRNLARRTITYRLDDETSRMFEIYLGCDPGLRKRQLSLPPPPPIPEIEAHRAECAELSASYHLAHEADKYQRDNLRRKLNGFCDGQVEAGRKIINGCLRIFNASPHEKRKIADLAGKISAEEQYHHGEESLQKTIIRRAFITPGGCQLPFLLPAGNTGTRLEGGHDASPARYVKAMLNSRVTSLVFRADDYPLLTFRIDEGKRGEPEYFMPIIPLVMLEQVDVPAHGWNISVAAREVVDVIAALRKLIKFGADCAFPAPRPCCYPRGAEQPTHGPPAWSQGLSRVIYDCADPAVRDKYMWHGYMIQRASASASTLETWSIGTYEWIARDTVHIDELPMCCWTLPYIKELDKLSESDKSPIRARKYEARDDCVDITVTFDVESPAFAALGIIPAAPGTRGPADLNDPVVIALHLRARMSDSLNFIMPDESVRSFATYSDVIREWFPLRRDFYALRIARQEELIRAWIAYYENVIRFIEMNRERRANIAELSDEEAEAFLDQHQFARMNVAALNSPNLKYEPHVAERVARDASFAYILDLRERDKTREGCAKFERALSAYRAQLDALLADAAPGPGAPFIGARIWLAELDELETVIARGRETLWQYDDYGRFVFSAPDAEQPAKIPRKPRAKSAPKAK